MKKLLAIVALFASVTFAQTDSLKLSPFDHLGHNMLLSAFGWPLGFHLLGGALTYKFSMENNDLMVARFAARQNELAYGIAFTPGMMMGTFFPVLVPGYMYFISDNKELNNTGAVAVQATAVAFLYNNILKAHISANLKIRTAEYVEQAIYNCLPYCGYPRTLNALRLLKEAAAALRQAQGPESTASKDNKIMDQATFDKQNVFGKGDPNVNYAKYFIGNSYLKQITSAEDGFRMSNVTFEPGTRNNWHIHHAKKGGGQVLIVTAGSGWYQLEGKPAVSLNPGDAVVIPANVKHWHGAKKDSWFSHIAFEAPGEGMSNEWLEPVTDEEYNKL